MLNGNKLELCKVNGDYFPVFGLFQDYELDALLGEYAEDYDRVGIIRDATVFADNGRRYWKITDAQLDWVLYVNDLRVPEDERERMREVLDA